MFIGLDTYVKRKGYNDPLLLKLAIAFHILSEAVFLHSTNSSVRSYVSVNLWSMMPFVDGMWTSLRALEPDESDELSAADDSQLAIWTEIFKTYRLLHSCVRRRLASDLRRQYPTFGRTWKETCYGGLPGPKHARLRERLLRLEVIHGDTMRKQFPSVK